VLLVIGLIQAMVLEHYQVHQETHVILQAIEAPAVPLYQLIGYVVIAAVVAPLAEELVFRGLLQTAVLQRGFGFLIPQFAPPSAEVKGWVPSVGHRWVAILVSSLLFTAVHLPYTMTAPIILPLALALGYLYERTGNLYAVIVLHALFNGTNLWMSRME
jgi:membrane protease YdiL (CAAX protease family)